MRIFRSKNINFESQIERAAAEAGGVFATRFGIWLLAMVSFVESALIVPIITDPFLVAYILVNRSRAWLACIVTTLASLLGGVGAYAVAAFLFDVVVGYFFNSTVPQHIYDMAAQFETGTFLITFLGAVTPIPYTVVALAAGSVHASLAVFIFASLLGRGLRYLAVTYLTLRFGERALERIRRNVLVSSILAIVLIAAYLVYKLA